MTTPRQFRLTDETLTDLDEIAEYLGAVRSDGGPNRAAAIRFAAREFLRRLRESRKKKPPKNSRDRG
jgi:plasmid stabilization system protein ParE